MQVLCDFLPSEIIRLIEGYFSSAKLTPYLEWKTGTSFQDFYWNNSTIYETLKADLLTCPRPFAKIFVSIDLYPAAVSNLWDQPADQKETFLINYSSGPTLVDRCLTFIKWMTGHDSTRYYCSRQENGELFAKIYPYLPSALKQLPMKFSVSFHAHDAYSEISSCAYTTCLLDENWRDSKYGPLATLYHSPVRRYVHFGQVVEGLQ